MVMDSTLRRRRRGSGSSVLLNAHEVPGLVTGKEELSIGAPCAFAQLEAPPARRTSPAGVFGGTGDRALRVLAGTNLDRLGIQETKDPGRVLGVRGTIRGVT